MAALWTLIAVGFWVEAATLHPRWAFVLLASLSSLLAVGLGGLASVVVSRSHQAQPPS